MTLGKIVTSLAKASWFSALVTYRAKSAAASGALLPRLMAMFCTAARVVPALPTGNGIATVLP